MKKKKKKKAQISSFEKVPDCHNRSMKSRWQDLVKMWGMVETWAFEGD